MALTELIGDALKRLSKATTTFSLVAALAAVREREREKEKERERDRERKRERRERGERERDLVHGRRSCCTVSVCVCASQHASVV